MSHHVDRKAPRTSPYSWLALIIAAGLVLRCALVPLYAHLTRDLFDETLWKTWMQAIHQHGVLNVFRTTDTNYIGLHWILWVLAWVYAPSGEAYSRTAPWLHTLVKIPSLLFDVILIWTVYEGTLSIAAQHDPERLRFISPQRARSLALAAAAVIAFQPAVIYDSAVWAQSDAAISAAMLGSMLLIARGRIGAGYVAWTLGFLLKPQPVVVLPVLLLLTLRAGGWRAILRAAAATLATGAVVLGPWLLHGDGRRILHVYHTLFFEDGLLLSGSAWNFWWLWPQHTTPLKDLAGADAFRTAGMLLSAASGAIGMLYCWRRPGLAPALVSAAYLTFAFYLWPVATHERYLYPLLALLLPPLMLDRRWLWVYAPLSAMLFANMFCAAPPVASMAERLIRQPEARIAAAFNIAAFFGFTLVMLRSAVPKPVHPLLRLGHDGAIRIAPATRTSRAS